MNQRVDVTSKSTNSPAKMRGSEMTMFGAAEDPIFISISTPQCESAQTIRTVEWWKSIALKCYPFEAMTPYIDVELGLRVNRNPAHPAITFMILTLLNFRNFTQATDR